MKSAHPMSAARCCKIALIAALGALLPRLHAQPTPAVSPTAPAADAKTDTVLLTPFEVNTEKDTGYVAASSLAGGRADTPLKLTPASISVMTKEFMDDLNITNLSDAMGWTANVETRSQASLDTNPFGQMEMNFRNVGGAGSYPTRNYFQFYFVSDGYNTERLEFSRGPNALLYGDSSIGGIAGQLTKQARFNDRRMETRLQADSYGGWRSTADISYGMDKFAVRVNGLVQRFKGFQNATFTDVNAIHVAMSYKIDAKTQFRAEHESNQTRTLLVQRTYPENASYWDRTTFNNDNSLIANPNNFGLQQVSATNSYLLYNFSHPENGILDYRGNQYVTRGTGFRIPWVGRTDIPNFARLPSKDFNLGPADARALRVLNTHAAYLDHRFTDDWFAQLAYSFMVFGPSEQTTDNLGNNYLIDVNRLLPNGLPNQNVGKPYADITLGHQYQENMVKDIRFLTTYKFAVPKLLGLNIDLKQRFSFIGGYRYDYFEMYTRSMRWINNPAQPNITNGVNQVRYRIYWDQPLPNITNNPPQTGIPGAVFKDVDTGFAARNQRQLVYSQIVSSSTFWNDRLSIIAGLRRDQLDIDNLSSYGNDPITGRLLTGVFDPKVNANVEGLHALSKPKATSANVGTVFFILPWVGLTANYSENFAVPTSGQNQIDGSSFDPAHGTGKDLGLKFSFLDNKVYATASYYDTKQVGSIIGGGNTTEMNRIWTNLGYTDTAHTAINYRDIQSIAATGYEFELTANLSRNFRMTFNHSRPQQKLLDSRPGQKKYFAANLAEWQAGANAAAGDVRNGKIIQNPAQIAADIQTVKDALDGLTIGSLANGTLKSSTNVVGTYSFTQGKLKGLSIGGGAQFRGERKNGSVDAQILYKTTTPTVQQTHDAAFAYLYVPSTTIVTAFASYDYRISKKVRARFQLNVANLLNDDSPQWNSYATLAANALLNGNPRYQVLSGFDQFDPRKFTFTSTFTF